MDIEMINQLGVSKQSVTVDWILDISDKQDNFSIQGRKARDSHERKMLTECNLPP